MNIQENMTKLSLFALNSTPEVMWSIMASFMLYVVDKYAWDFYMENANLLTGYRAYQLWSVF